ncbi:uncharacterized protein RB166_009695 [Leptodactylus fuscus]
MGLIRVFVRQAVKRKKLRLKELQSLLGKLNFACRIIPMGRVFNRRLAAATLGVSHPHHFVHLGKELRGDLRVWHSFLVNYNGRSLIRNKVVDSVDMDLFTDAAGSVGFGAYCQGRWCFGMWPPSWVESGWDKFRDKKVRFNCDNLGVVQAINNLSASSPPVVCLLQKLVLLCLSLNAWVVASHVPGVFNCVADAISRSQWKRFRELAPEAEEVGDPFPEDLWDLPFGRLTFVAVFRKCVVASGREPKEFGSHSFRIGAATEAARHGLGEDVVRKIGRWESIRFRSYLRPGWLN